MKLFFFFSPLSFFLSFFSLSLFFLFYLLFWIAFEHRNIYVQPKTATGDCRPKVSKVSINNGPDMTTVVEALFSPYSGPFPAFFHLPGDV